YFVAGFAVPSLAVRCQFGWRIPAHPTVYRPFLFALLFCGQNMMYCWFFPISPRRRCVSYRADTRMFAWWKNARSGGSSELPTERSDDRRTARRTIAEWIGTLTPRHP